MLIIILVVGHPDDDDYEGTGSFGDDFDKIENIVRYIFFS